MSSGLYPRFVPGSGADDASRIEACERNILDLYKLLAGVSGLMPITADDAELTALMAGAGSASTSQVQRGLDSAEIARIMEVRGVSRAEVRRMMEEVLVEIAMTVRPLSRNDVQRLVDDAVQAASSVRGISRAEVQKMIDDAMISVIMD